MCLLDTWKTSMKKKVLGRTLIFFFSWYDCRHSLRTSCSVLITTGAPPQSLPRRHFSYPPPALPGGLLGEAEAGQLAIHSLADSLSARTLSRWSRSHGNHRCDRLARDRLLESHRSLRKVAWTVQPTFQVSEQVSWHSLDSHFPLWHQWKPLRWEISDPMPVSPPSSFDNCLFLCSRQGRPSVQFPESSLASFSCGKRFMKSL